MASEPLRERFDAARGALPAQALADRLLPLLLAQSGSTTRLCECLAGGAVGLVLRHQAWLDAAPPAARPVLGAGPCLERVTSIVAHGQVMMDNLSYIGVEGLDPSMLRGLEQGSIPIGHLVEDAFVRRTPLPDATALLPRLWDFVGLPDAAAGRAYVLSVSGGANMVIAECFRAGMLAADTGRR